jgi:enoyl-CoA hydratase/carnithine racemase
MGSVDVDYTDDGRVAWITLNNLPKHNAMSFEMWQKLEAVLAGLGERARCVVLRGAGDQAFVSGADISEFIDRRRSPDDIAVYDAAADAAMKRLDEFEVPTVAMISGYCFGGGVALAMCCDVRIAADTAQFAVPAARIGLGYPWVEIERLLRATSAAVVTDILISARRLPAAEALSLGLVSQVHPCEQLYDVVAGYAGAVAANAPLTVRAARRVVRELSSRDAPDIDVCERLVAQCFASNDYVEGTRAFMDRRTPRFDGR